MKMSLREMICRIRKYQSPRETGGRVGAYVLMTEVLKQLQFAIGTFGQNRCTKRLHDLLDGNILVGELVSGGAAGSAC